MEKTHDESHIHFKKLKVRDLLQLDEEKKHIAVNGWVKTKRDSKSFSFIELNDGSSIKNIQIIADSSLYNYEAEIKKLNMGASIRVEGDLIKSPGKGQKHEISAKNITVYGMANPLENPLQKNELTMEYLRTYPHLRPRTTLFGAMFRIRNELSFAIHKFFHEKHFYYVHTPLITSSDCEGAGQTFQVTTLDLDNVPKTEDGKTDYSKDFFTKKAFLTVSGQLEGEIFATSLVEIYTFGPTFRSERSNTTRHMAEFWMIEPEMAFYDMDDLMDIEEEFVQYLIKHILENCQEDMEYMNEKVEPGIIHRLKHVASSSFKRIAYNEAIEILEKSDKKFEVKPVYGMDLGSEHERYLCEEHFKLPVLVYNYPKDIKPFYGKQNDDGTVRCVDVLVPGVGEIMSSGQREDDYEKLLNRIKELNMDEKAYSWYLELRKFGTVPHSGFGIGFERFMMYLTGVSNIRDTIPIPRAYKELEF